MFFSRFYYLSYLILNKLICKLEIVLFFKNVFVGSGDNLVVCYFLMLNIIIYCLSVFLY